ncbi:integrase, catalytic region, zinc finger, CCHC-type containing protein [Tanacetum coccineum]
MLVEMIAKRKKFFVAQRAAKQRSKPPTKTQIRNRMCAYLKNMDELESNKSKKQKIDEYVEAKKDDDQEEEEMKRHIEIVKDDDVAIDAIPLATKPLIIVEYKIDKDGINAAYAQLQLLSDYYCWKDYVDREGIKIDWRIRILTKISGINNLLLLSISDTAKFGNDQIAKIMGYVDYQIRNITISRVYYLEGLGHTLFSFGQFCDLDLEVAFRKHTCFVHNLEGVDLLSGSQENNLYTLSIGVASINGKKYILIIVDDYSQITWVKFLASKDEAPDFIIKFLKMMQVRLNAPVRNIRTDNGTEFVNQTLRSYYESNVRFGTSLSVLPRIALGKYDGFVIWKNFMLFIGGKKYGLVNFYIAHIPENLVEYYFKILTLDAPDEEVKSKVKSHEKRKLDDSAMSPHELVEWAEQEAGSPYLRTPPIKPRRKGIEFPCKNLFGDFFLHCDSVADEIVLHDNWKYEGLSLDGHIDVGGPTTWCDLVHECVVENGDSLPIMDKECFSNNVVLDDVVHANRKSMPLLLMKKGRNKVSVTRKSRCLNNSKTFRLRKGFGKRVACGANTRRLGGLIGLNVHVVDEVSQVTKQGSLSAGSSNTEDKI